MNLAAPPRPGSQPAGTHDTPGAFEKGFFRTAALTAGTYALMVLIMWGAYNVFSGFPYETSLPYYSETHPGLAGFYYAGDPLRVYENHFYHLSFVLSEILGIRGSYVPYQVVYASLWWARGLLVFLLIRRFLPSRPLLAYMTGALVLVHSSDGAMMWVGQMNQFGFIFWMLLAFLALTLSLEAPWRFAIPLLLAAVLLEHRSLWSYESQILVILLFPLLLILHPRRTWRKLLPLAAVWYVVPLIYIRLTAQRYSSGAHTYQETVERKVWSASAIVSDWGFNVWHSLAFWQWLETPWQTVPRPAVLLSLLLAAIFVAGGVALAWLCGPQERGRNWQTVGGLHGSRILGWLLASGGAILLLSFPVYLFLDLARNLWRTQMLSGIGAGIVLAAVAGLVARMIPHGRGRRLMFLSLGAMVAFAGSVSAIQKGARHRAIWERHRDAVREILEVAPSVQSNTVVVLTNVPKGQDPFGDGLWYDMALRLMYIDRKVAGIFIYSDGTRAPGDSLVARAGHWVWNGLSMEPLVKDPPISRTVVIRYVPGGQARLEAKLPSEVCAPDCSAAAEYNPRPLITGPMLPSTRRRYNLTSGH